MKIISIKRIELSELDIFTVDAQALERDLREWKKHLIT